MIVGEARSAQGQLVTLTPRLVVDVFLVGLAGHDANWMGGGEKGRRNKMDEGRK